MPPLWTPNWTFLRWVFDAVLENNFRDFRLFIFRRRAMFIYLYFVV